jgi:hypothetical protein
MLSASHIIGVKAFPPAVKYPGLEADQVSYLVPRLRIVKLYLHFPIRLHGMVLKN